MKHYDNQSSNIIRKYTEIDDKYVIFDFLNIFFLKSPTLEIFIIHILGFFFPFATAVVDNRTQCINIQQYTLFWLSVFPPLRKMPIFVK